MISDNIELEIVYKMSIECILMIGSSVLRINEMRLLRVQIP